MVIKYKCSARAMYAETGCPFKVKSKYDRLVMVGSLYCQSSCKYHQSIDYDKKNVICNYPNEVTNEKSKQ